MTDVGKAGASTMLASTGLDPRSIADLVRWTAGLKARIKVGQFDAAGEKVSGEASFVCDPPSPGAFLRLLVMGIRPGERVEITAEGPDAQEAVRRVEKVFGEEPPPPVNAELDRALRWWVAVCASADLSEEMQAKVRELVDDHIQHAIYYDRLWTGEEEDREAARKRWVYTNRSDTRQMIEVYRVCPVTGYFTEDFMLESGELREFESEPRAYMSVWSPGDGGGFRKRQEKFVRSLCETLPTVLSRELDIPKDELIKRWFK